MSEVTPDLHVGPSPDQAQPVGPVSESALVGQVPAPKVVTLDKLNTRMNAKFAYEQVTDVVKELLLLADVPAGIIIDPDEREVSMISFEDEPLRYCLDRLRHLVSGTCEVNDQGEVEFAAGV